MGKTQEEALIPLSRLCRAALEECRKRVVGHEFVFVSEDPACREPSTGASGPQWSRVPEVRVLRAFETAKEMAGITRRFRFHDLRHTFASTLASQGVSLQVIAKARGHTTTRMSERYARPSEEAIRKAAEALDRANQSSAVNCSRELVTINGVTSAAAGVAFSQRANEMAGGRCRDRTGDLLRVKQTLCR
jgi:integrase